MRKKVLLVANNDFALVNYRTSLIDRLCEEFDVFTVVTDASKVSNMSCTGSVRRSSRIVVLDLIYLLFAIYQLNRCHRFYAVFSFTIFPGLVSGFFGRIFGYKHIHTVTGLGRLFDVNKETNFPIKALVRLCLSKSFALVFQTEQDLRAYEKIFVDRKLNGVVVNGSGVDLTSFPFYERHHRELDERVFVYVGRIKQDKGARQILDAVKHIDEEGAPARFELYGDFYLSEYLKRQILEYCEKGSLTYHGFSTDVAEALKSADFLFYYSTYNEGIPRAILEAMSCGVVPVINERIYRASERILSGAVVVNECDFLSEVVRLANIPEIELQSMRQRVRDAAGKNFNIDKINDAYLKLLKN